MDNNFSNSSDDLDIEQKRESLKSEYIGEKEFKYIDVEEAPYIITNLPEEVTDKYVHAIMILDIVSIILLIVSYNRLMNNLIQCTDLMDLFTIDSTLTIFNLVNALICIIKFVLLIKDIWMLYKKKLLKPKLVVAALLFKPSYIWYRAKELKREMTIYYVYVALLSILIIWWLKDIYVTVNQLSDKIYELIDSNDFQGLDPYSNIIPE